MCRILRLVAIVICLVTMSSSFAASFDCTKPQTAIDSLICRSSKVSTLDETLSSLYKDALQYQQGVQRQAVIEGQRKWLKEWRDVCDDESCLINMYQLRIEAMQELVPSTPLKCPHCGRWVVSNSNIPSLVSDWVLIDETSVRIKGCGEFFYNNSEIQATRVSDKRHDYIFQTQFTGRSDSGATSICSGGSEALWDPRKWRLEMSITGHFQEAGYADFVLTQSDMKAPVLTFTAWGNEDPCSAGSGFGSVACFLTNNGELRKALWMAIDLAEFKSSERCGKKCFRPFNLNKFLARIQNHCSENNKDNGFGSWPSAWSEGCVGEQMTAKLKQFRNWEACSSTNVKALKCAFPIDDIDK